MSFGFGFIRLKCQNTLHCLHIVRIRISLYNLTHIGSWPEIFIPINTIHSFVSFCTMEKLEILFTKYFKLFKNDEYEKFVLR